MAKSPIGVMPSAVSPLLRSIAQSPPLFSPPVAGRQFKPTGFINNSGVTYQRIYEMYGDAVHVRFVFQNFAQTGSPNESSVGTYTLKAGVVWGSSTQIIYPITFNGGQRSIDVPAYATVISDPIEVEQSVLSGDFFAVRSYVTMAGAYLPYEASSQTINGRYEGYIAGDLSDSIGNNYGGATGGAFGPILVCGHPVTGEVPSIYGAGDSIMAGTGWSGIASQPYAAGFLGYFCSVNKVGVYNAARSGETLATALNMGNAGSGYRMARAHGLKYGVCEYGTNDIGASATLSTLKTNLIEYWRRMKARGLTVYQTTITPRTNSTDRWATVANQSNFAGPDQELTRQQLNQWLRAPASAGAGNSALFDAGGKLFGVIDTCKKVEANADGSIITINPTTGAISNGSGGFWWVDTTIYESGTTSSWVNSQKPVDATKTWATNQWWGYAMRITADATVPSAIGTVQQIYANTSTQLTTDSFSPAPSTGAAYQMVKITTTDGVHPATPGHILMASALQGYFA